eukprot:m.72598 g.72598  ORF g.72598 m.72598 type:complete len:274 (-) comp12338_c0_seq2:2055-2876(-)
MASGAKGRPRRVGDSLKQKHMGDSDDYEPHTYHLRVGPNYKRNKKKEAYTGPLLYDFVSLDLFRSNHIVQNNIKYIQLPALPPNRRITNGVPPYLVVTVNLPLYSAGFWPKDDGECFQYVTFTKSCICDNRLALHPKKLCSSYHRLPTFSTLLNLVHMHLLTLAYLCTYSLTDATCNNKHIVVCQTMGYIESLLCCCSRKALKSSWNRQTSPLRRLFSDYFVTLFWMKITEIGSKYALLPLSRRHLLPCHGIALTRFSTGTLANSVHKPCSLC